MTKFLLATVALLASVSAPAQTVTAVPKLDDTRVAGAWYEIARLPNRHEKACVSGTFELAARGDKLYQLQFVDSCKTGKAYNNIRNFNASPQDKLSKLNGDGRLKVTAFWPFSVKRWVLAVGPEYEWSLIGSPNHKSLWIFSRTPTLAPEVLAAIKSKAAAEGFPVDHLVATPQAVPPSTPALSSSM